MARGGGQAFQRRRVQSEAACGVCGPWCGEGWELRLEKERQARHGLREQEECDGALWVCMSSRKFAFQEPL